MKVFTLFAHFTDEQYKSLSEKYPGETALKIFLHEKLTGEVLKEVEQIKNDKALAVLGATEKL